jgi:hypothetical protein
MASAILIVLTTRIALITSGMSTPGWAVATTAVRMDGVNGKVKTSRSPAHDRHVMDNTLVTPSRAPGDPGVTSGDAVT